jgi:hypothetical protein
MSIRNSCCLTLRHGDEWCSKGNVGRNVRRCNRSMTSMTLTVPFISSSFRSKVNAEIGAALLLVSRLPNRDGIDGAWHA